MNGMSQDALRDFFENCWRSMDSKASKEDSLVYSSPVEDAVLYPAYVRFLHELGVDINGKSILDVGCGSGRWVRFFLENFRPAHLAGMDLAASSVEMMKKWYRGTKDVQVDFRVGDIASTGFEEKLTYDLVNVANVLFHLVEPQLFRNAVNNIARLLKPDGIAVTTEYLPATTFRTNMMLVHSRDDFEQVVSEAGLEIADIRACSFFSNDPMGLDVSENKTRDRFAQVRSDITQLLSSSTNDQTRKWLTDLLINMELGLLEFSRQRIPEIDFPSQKLVALRARND